jgi:serine/threonine protein kinase
MSRSGLLGNRYRIEPTAIGQGGMGVVYRAFDTDLEREVALKTIRGPVDAAAIEQFRKESRTLARLCHSNIVDIYDVGEFEDSDGRKPYFVMPLLSGSNLGDLLNSSGSRIDPERLVGIICQACKALQAAHIKDVVHCDLKPSNLFVLEDDSVKVIDFGIRHLVGADSATRLQGTLNYMSPEQLEGKVTPQTDIFSLGIVCYEALTGRKPFLGRTEAEVIDSIRSRIPPSISEVNPAIPHLLAQVVHRALAKQPYHRLSTAREFSDLLQKASRNEPLPQFDRTRIASRVARIRKALAEGDCPYAREMLTELGSEGHIDHEISLLSIQAEDAIRARTTHQLLESARLRLEEEDYPLAMQKVQSVLDLDRENIDALALKREIDEKRGIAGIDRWYQIARQHLDNNLFSKAREAVDEILRIDQDHARARELLSEIARGEQEHTKLRQEVQRLYDSVLKAYGKGEISTALTKLERVMELGKRVSGHPQTDAQYESLYNEIRRERDELQTLYAEARKALETNDFDRAQQICQQVLDRRPGDALFQALKISVDEGERQTRSAAIADLHHRIEIEPDLESKLQVAKQAVTQFPDEQTFAQSLKSVRQKRDLVNSICARARHYASHGQFTEARNQWDILRNIYPKYPGLDHELERLNREQQQALEEEAKADSAGKAEPKLPFEDFAIGPDIADLPRETIVAPSVAPFRAERKPESQKPFQKQEQPVEFPNDFPQFNKDLWDSDRPPFAADSAPFARAAAISGTGVSVKIQDPSPPPSAKREAAAQPRPEARVTTPSVDYAATQLFAAGQGYVSGFEAAPVAAPDSGQPEQYQPKLQSDKVADPIDSNREHFRSRRRTASLDDAEHGFVFNRKQIAVAASVVAALILVYLGAGWLRSKPPLDTQRTSRGASITRSSTPAATAGSTDQLNNRTPAPAVPSNSTANQAAAPQASAQQHPRPPHSLATAPVTFESNPSPALVRVDDGDATCHTPCDLKLEAGAHTVSFLAENHQTVEKAIEVPQDQKISVSLPDQLESVRVISDPPGLTLSIDGAAKGETPLTVQLAAGEHRLQIGGNGLHKDQTIQVSHGDGLQVITVKPVQSAPAASP